MSRQTFDPIGLRAQNLGCDRGGHPVFRGVDFVLSAGEAMILRGDNGAGKTSLLRLIAGLCPITEGELHLREMEHGWKSRDASGLIAWQGHEDAHKSALSVRENLRFWARLHPDELNIEAALDRVGIAALADNQAAQLSAGQKRRLALARLLIQNKPLWLLDEPTAALDAKAATMSEDLIAGHLRAGGIAIIATHSAFAPKGKVSALNLVAAP